MSRTLTREGDSGNNFTEKVEGDLPLSASISLNAKGKVQYEAGFKFPEGTTPEQMAQQLRAFHSQMLVQFGAQLANA